MRKLRFTYDEPGSDAPQPLQPGNSIDTPGFIEWRPAINSTAEQVRTQLALAAPPGIPWTTSNITEIRVQSRKAYEILRRIVPEHIDPLVRILPPKPIMTQAEKKLGFTICTHQNKPEEIVKAAQLAKALGCSDSVTIISTHDADCNQPFYYEALAKSYLVAFLYSSSSFLEHLAYSVSHNCLILSSDAGAAEEYLCRFAVPGMWHVCKTFETKEWSNKARDLLGQDNEAYQTGAVDLTPYVQPWEDRK